MAELDMKTMDDLGVKKDVAPGEIARVEQEALATGFVKEIVRLDPKRIAPLERLVGDLAEHRKNDPKFQQHVLNYLNLMIQYLKSPIIKDTFGDTPEGHEERKNTIRKAANKNDELLRFFESQKISKNQLSVVGVISENVIPFLYPAPTPKGAETLQVLAKEGEPLLAEIEEKLNRGSGTPLAEKIALVHRAEDFLEKSILTIAAVYAERGTD